MEKSRVRKLVGYTGGDPIRAIQLIAREYNIAVAFATAQEIEDFSQRTFTDAEREEVHAYLRTPAYAGFVADSGVEAKFFRELLRQTGLDREETYEQGKGTD